jgi:hypothetical protein
VLNQDSGTCLNCTAEDRKREGVDVLGATGGKKECGNLTDTAATGEEEVDLAVNVLRCASTIGNAHSLTETRLSSQVLHRFQEQREAAAPWRDRGGGARWRRGGRQMEDGLWREPRRVLGFVGCGAAA